MIINSNQSYSFSPLTLRFTCNLKNAAKWNVIIYHQMFIDSLLLNLKFVEGYMRNIRYHPWL